MSDDLRTILGALLIVAGLSAAVEIVTRTPGADIPQIGAAR